MPICVNCGLKSQLRDLVCAICKTPLPKMDQDYFLDALKKAISEMGIHKSDCSYSRGEHFVAVSIGESWIVYIKDLIVNIPEGIRTIRVLNGKLFIMVEF